MICDWCGYEIESYGAHFEITHDCRQAALAANRPPAAHAIDVANTETERARIRRTELSGWDDIPPGAPRIRPREELPRQRQRVARPNRRGWTEIR